MIQVEAGVYIGAASDLKDAQDLTNAGITHILTVDSEQPASPDGPFRMKYVYCLDESSTDLLSHLDDCIRFICDACEASKSVLVHCHVGQSRSAAVVTAYLMKCHKMNFGDAYAKLQQLKPDVKMNEGFVDQLALYESLGCEVDVTRPQYKQYRLQKLTEKYPELQNVPKELFAVDPYLSTCSEVEYRCKKCRRTLFRASSILSHTIGNGPTAFAYKKMSNLPSGDQTQCTSYFTEPVQWMEQALLGVMDGQILCPKCRSKLGSFSWCGEQCSCGRWVTPAFQMHKNRVDEIKHISIATLKS
ncbi:dual specificity protein phosphatase 12 [Salvelinus namaycush]|uniref:Dual specificity protein phosphatase 12 n=1 Tax=Salvelinus namaycush TaxID=8040 RepID=A0A8U0P6X2_SALNM|nr:dual specificity protein phosphatase 12 [Salvelinus namaycush]XP_038819403.1 dual specificity protein phosphatase 12 [Salvelinus namaycush]